MSIEQLAGADPAAVTPAEFARIVKGASKDQLASVMNDPETRARVLDAVFGRMGESYRGSRSVNAVVQWRITEKPGGGADLYVTTLRDGTCTVEQSDVDDPRCTFSLTGPEFLKLASGTSAPTVMFMTGKVKISGDLGFAAGLGNLFAIPKA